MNAGEWIGIGALAVTLLGGGIGWLMRLERRQGTYLTRAEHEQICQDRNDRVEKSIDDLREDMETRHTENRGVLSDIQTTVTGTHRRMDEVLLALLRDGGGR